MDPEKQMLELKIKTLHLRVQRLEQALLTQMRMQVNLYQAESQWKIGMIMLLKSLPLGLPSEIYTLLEALQCEHKILSDDAIDQQKEMLSMIEMQADQSEAISLQIFEENDGKIEGL